LLDDVQMDACIRYSQLTEFAAKPTLCFEFHGTEAGVREQAETIESIASDHGGSRFQWATKPEERSRLWKARHAAYYATLALKPGMTAIATDACVPISRLAECILQTKADIEKSGLTVTIVGHVGDGNFHLVVLDEPGDAGQRERADALARAVSMRAIGMGGTCTGEHGIGWHKLDLLAQEHGEAVDLMRSIKRALDPQGIMNPGKTVPF
jgi:D-lactate dehydrogenase (cytochrome)